MMLLCSKTERGSAVLLTFSIAKVDAILPASQEQLVCGASSMVLGEVVQASSENKRNLVEFTVRVIDELPGGTKKVGNLGVIEVSTITQRPHLSADDRVLGLIDETGTLEVGEAVYYGSAMEGLLKDQDVKKAFIGKRFYFGIWSEMPEPKAWAKMWTVDGPGLVIWKRTCPHSIWRPWKNG